MAGRRLTRKEIVQEDQIHSTINQILVFVIEKKNLLLAVLGGVAVLAGAVYLWTDRQASQKAELQLAFAQAQDIFRASIGEPKPAEPGAPPDTRLYYKTESEKYAAAIKAFSELAARTEGTSLGAYSRYYEALSLRGAGRTDDYTKLMQEMAAKASQPELTSLAAYSLADHYLSLGSPDKAQPYFDAILKDDKTLIPKDSILNQMGEYYEKINDTAKAQAAFDRLVKEHPESQLRKNYETRMATQAVSKAQKR